MLILRFRISIKVEVKNEKTLRQLLKDPKFSAWAGKSSTTPSVELSVSLIRNAVKDGPVVYDVGTLDQFLLI